MALKPIMFIGSPFEVFEIEGTEHLLDNLCEGGVDEILLGRMWVIVETSADDPEAFIYQPTRPIYRDSIRAYYANRPLHGRWAPTFAPNAELYRGLTLRPPAFPPAARAKAEVVSHAIRAARARGMKVYLFGTDHHQGATMSGLGQEVSLTPEYKPGDCLNDPDYAAYFCANTRDCFANYPDVSGFMMDGPEYGYELQPGHRSDIFKCFCPHCEAKALRLGYDFAEMRATAARLRERLMRLTAEEVRGFLDVRRGVVDAIELLMRDPALLNWLRFKTDCVIDFVSTVQATVKSLSPDLQLGVGSRTASFAPLTGYDQRRLAGIADFQAPKLYIWMRGVDGFYGTVDRWARTLLQFAPRLSEQEALRAVTSFFGFPLPGVERFTDLDRGFPNAFFDETIAAEIGTMIERVGDPTTLRPWIGLEGHGGDLLMPHDLRRLLSAARNNGLSHYIYHIYNHMHAGEWQVVREFALGHG